MAIRSLVFSPKKEKGEKKTQEVKPDYTGRRDIVKRCVSGRGASLFGDICCRSEVLGHLAYDVRQGAHARKVMESYQTWFGDGPELAVRINAQCQRCLSAWRQITGFTPKTDNNTKKSRLSRKFLQCLVLQRVFLVKSGFSGLALGYCRDR